MKGAAVGAPAVLTFDKDDEDTLDFVAASANLRSLVFGIEPRSKFDIKRMRSPYCSVTPLADISLEMAGNIIPAIATTNAMTASLCVLQAFKVMREDLSKAKMVRQPLVEQLHITNNSPGIPYPLYRSRNKY